MERTERFNPAMLPAGAVKGLTGGSSTKASKFLLPGQMFASREATTVTTILGSCVAVCLWDPIKGIGGMNHYLLPDGSGTDASRLRYGNHANAALLNELLAMGCALRDLHAKVFGGASMMASADPASSLGKRNMELALDFLKEHRIPLVGKHVSEQRGCKLTFQTNDGVTQIKTFEDQ